MSIATKTGDKGETGLYSGERVSKSDPRIECLGALDELSAIFGMVNPQFANLEVIRHELFDLGALIANTKTSKNFLKPLARLEAELEILEANLPPLRNFVLPGGHAEASKIHLARAVTRRAERSACELQNLPEGVYEYMNRLSDYLFMLAREINYKTNTDEIPWKSVL